MNFDVVMVCSKYELSEEIFNNNNTERATKIIEKKFVSMLQYSKRFH